MEADISLNESWDWIFCLLFFLFVLFWKPPFQMRDLQFS